MAVVAVGTRVHAESADEASVRQAVADLTAAMLAADPAKLAALVAEQLSYGHSGGVIQSKAEFVDVIASKKTVYKSINLTDVKIASPATMPSCATLGTVSARSTASRAHRRSACCRSG
jgi:hypothetical protein